MAFILWYLIWRLRGEHKLGVRIYLEIETLISQGTFILLLIPVAMVLMNWSLEAIKWQLLSDKVEKLTFRESLAGVLAGQSLAFATPQSLGDYAGRVLNLKASRRSEAIGAVLLGRWVQSMVTGIFGSLGLLLVLIRELSLSRPAGVAVGFFLIIFWGMLIFLLLNKRAWLVILMEKLLGARLIKYVQVIKSYRQQEILKIMWLGLGRYLVFSFQFFIILKLFDLELNTLVILAGITWMFLIKSVMPAINIFTDLGVREMAVVYFFGHYRADLAIIILASVLLWILNILLPTFIGLFYVYRLKITSAR